MSPTTLRPHVKLTVPHWLVSGWCETGDGCVGELGQSRALTDGQLLIPCDNSPTLGITAP